MSDDKAKAEARECQNCEEIATEGEMLNEFGFICQDCLDKCVNYTGYCSMSCQLNNRCDGTC